MNLAALAEQALGNLSLKQHARPDKKSYEVAVPDIEFEVSEDSVNSNSGWKTEFDSLHDAVGAALVSIVDAQNTTTAKLLRRIALGDEELQMLWWLTAGHSRLADKPFAKIDPAQQPLLLGKELARMTTVSPGPASLGAILDRAGAGSKKIVIADAINSIDQSLASEFSKQSTISPATTPLHYALEQRSELDSLDAWQAGWQALTGLDPAAGISAAAIGTLFYREHLFLHVSS